MIFARLLRQLSAYTGAQFSVIIFNLCIQGILARICTPSELGLYDYCLVLITFVSSVSMHGVDSALARHLLEEKTLKSRYNIICASINIQLLQYSGVVIAGILLFTVIKGFLPNTISRFFPIIFVIGGLVSLIDNFLSLFLWTRKTLQFSLLSISSSFIFLSLLFVCDLIPISGSSNTPIFILIVIFMFSKVLAACFGMTLALPSANKYYQFISCIPPVSAYKAIFCYALPLGTTALVTNIYPLIQRALIENLYDATQLGYFALASKIASLILIFQIILYSVWAPYFVENRQHSHFHILFNLSIKSACFVASIVISTFASFGLLIVKALGGISFYPSTYLLLPLICAQCFLLVESFVSVVFSATKKTEFYLLTNLVGLGSFALFIYLFRQDSVYGFCWFIALSALIRLCFVIAILIVSSPEYRLSLSSAGSLTVSMLIASLFYYLHQFTFLLCLSVWLLSILVCSFLFFLSIDLADRAFVRKLLSGRVT